MLKYHVNPETGKIAQCRAQKAPCRFGEANHYSTPQEAQKALENAAQGEQLIKHRAAQIPSGEPTESEATIVNTPGDPAPESAAEAPAQDNGFLSRPGGGGVFKKLVMPSIYAFVSPELNEVNSFYAVKLGDTKRTVAERMAEWKQMGPMYKNLQVLYSLEASFLDKHNRRVYVRDYNFHQDLEKDGFTRLVDVKEKYDMLETKHVSQEFYLDLTGKGRTVTKEIAEASLQKQINAYEKPGSGYVYYNSLGKSERMVIHYYPEADFKPRPFQQRIIDDCSEYLLSNREKGDENLFLLSAPTRSGKSFMAAQSSLKIFEESGRKNNTALIVSGFAEIEDEWRRAYESHKDFNQKEYGTAETNICGTDPCTCKSKFVYLNKYDLVKDPNAVQEAFKNGAENVAVFLTLQDLAGSTSGRKNETFEAHDFLMEPGAVQLVLGDESHFAMFTKDGEYQRVLNGDEDGDAIERDSDSLNLSDGDFEKAGKRLGQLHPDFGKLFITATPYNALSEGKHFDMKRNVSIITEGEIWGERDRWNRENLTKDVDSYYTDPDGEEDEGRRPWDSPYFGLVEKKSFAIDLGGDPNEIFAPKSSRENLGFKNPEAVKNIVKSLFGNGESAPNILRNKNFMEAGLGKNIYVSLPMCASCDAMEETLGKVLEEEGLAEEYEILNISSTDGNAPFTKMTAPEINEHISSSEKKTITLTVNRMGTGVSQEKWDSVFIMRSITSAQKFTQISGRCGTPYVTTQSTWDKDPAICRRCEDRSIRAEGTYLCAPCFEIEGEARENAAFKDSIVKTVEKPSAAVVSFDAEQMLKIYYDNSRFDAYAKADGKTAPGEKVAESLEQEMEEAHEVFYSNYALEKSGLEKVTASNILNHVFDYINSKGVREVAEAIGVSDDISPKLKEVLEFASEDRAARPMLLKAFTEELNKGEGKCFVRGCNRDVRGVADRKNNRISTHFCGEHYREARERRAMAEALRGDSLPPVTKELTPEEEAKIERERLRKEAVALRAKIRTLYANALLFASLSPEEYRGLGDALNSIRRAAPGEHNGYQEGRACALARRLGLDVHALQMIHDENIGGEMLGHSMHLMGENFRNAPEGEESKWERFGTALNSFGRFSRSELPTPEVVSEMLVNNFSMNKKKWGKFAEAKGGVADIGCKSAINLVKFYEAGRAAGVSHEAMANEIYAAPTSPATYELTRKVFEVYGWNGDNIFYADGVSNVQSVEIMALAMEAKGCRAKDPSLCKIHGERGVGTPAARMRREFKTIVDKIGGRDAKEAAAAIFERAKEMEPFEYCISNPPYQGVVNAENNGVQQATVVNVFQEFQNLGKRISRNTSMVYPGARWIQRSGKGLNNFGKEMLNDPSLKSVDYYDSLKTRELFPGVELGDGVSVVNWSADKKTKNFKFNGTLVKNPGDKIMPVDTKLVPIVEKINLVRSAKGLESLHESVSSRVLFGVESDFVEKNPEKVEAILDGQAAPAPGRFKDAVKILTNDQAGKAGRAKMFWIERSDIPRGHEALGKWKYAVKSAQFAHETNQIDNAVILDNKTAFGRSKVALKMFDTKAEVQNFAKVMETPLFKKLYHGSVGGGLAHIGEFVPDLGDYTNANPIFQSNKELGIGHPYYGLKVEKRLQEYFKISDGELEELLGE